MKYFNPSYWFKLWLLSAPLFNDKTQGINAKSIDNKKIKDWASNNTSLESINQEISYTNSSTNYQPYNLNETNQNIDPIYQKELETSTHKHRHEKSRRIKKQVTPHPRPSKEILKLNEKLIINQNNRREYQTSFQTIINELVDRGTLRRIRDLNQLVNPDFICEDNIILALNPESNYGYFRLPVAIRWQQNTQSIENNLELVLRTDNLYLQGFIVNNNYYHFDFTNINMNMQPQAVRDGSVPLLERIEGIQNNIVLNEISPDYRDMIRENDENIYWSNIFGSFFQLINRMDDNFNEQGILIEGALGNLARSLGDVILVTAESLRFWSLHTHIIQNLVNNNHYITLGRNNRNPIYNTLVNWNEESRTQSLIIDLLSTPNDRRPNPNSNQEARNILTEFGYLRRRDDEYFTNFLSRILTLPINQLTNILGHSNIRIILSFFIKRNLDNCNRRQARQIINNNYWHKKFCDLKPQIDKIEGKITAIKVLDENTKGENLKEGDILLGTTEGLYLIRQGDRIDKFDNLNYSIKDIILDKKNEIYFLSHSGEVINLKININMLKNNILSSTISIITIFNSKLEQIKILSIKEITKNSNDNYLKEGDIYAWTDDGGYLIRNRDLFGKIDINKHYIIHHDDNHIEEVHYNHNDNTYCHSTGKKIAAVSTATAIGATTGSIIPGIGTLIGAAVGGLIGGIGAVFITAEGCGYKLKREIFDINNLKEKNELKNLKKWTNEFTKSINHEQHLAIDNTNLVKSNITRL